MKVQARISSEPPKALDELESVMNFLNNVRIREVWNFRLAIDGKAGKEIPGSSRLELPANNLALSNAEGINSGPLNRGGIADLRFVKNSISN